MNGIRNNLKIRKSEADNIINFLKLIENEDMNYQAYTIKKLIVKTSIKSGIILMLYNAVEAIVTDCLKKIHQKLISEALTFDNCNENIKKLIFVYYEKAKDKSNDVHNRISYMLKFHDYIQEKRCFELSYEELSKFYSLYSGNLDGKVIISVLNKYGLGFDKQIGELKTIKDKRNKLAHGEESFEEVGRELSLEQLESMKDKTFQYLKEMIDEIDRFIRDEKYKN
ncbi:MAE_28990/MAE_18760 family HEPN-like nuclease [Phascolarctobacterium faecium]|jgi:hypothetical protein|uniref:MAE_28990/MAE_18760 family HEPN-like nuclease n=1 Tax=Phascolarctobacterium faecium TaxID=33025 RepID=UPI00265E0798|nr:MAE_28990/MAE_18760 family HEPN-like nuclease [Phascolarctobacterium faecium]